MTGSNQQPRVLITKELVVQFVVIAICLIMPVFLVTDLQLLPFMIIAAAIFGLLILKKPFIGLIIYMFVFYIRPQEIWFTGAVALERTIGIALLVLTLLRMKLKDDFRFKITNIHIAILAFLVVALINVTTSFWISASWDSWVKLLRLFVVFFCVVHLIDNEKQFKFFILFTILGTAFHATSAVINYYNGIVEVEMGIERAFAMDTSYGDPNSLAATIVYTLPLIYYYFTRKTPGWTRILLIGIMLISVWCVILTGSRTGMAGVIVFGVMAIWGRPNRIRNFILVAVALVSLALLTPGEYQQRFESITNFDTRHDQSGAAYSARSRWIFMKYGFQMLLTRPLTGYGMGNFATTMGMVYNQSWLQAHTLPAQIMGEMGMTGIIAFTLWIVILFMNIKKLRLYFKKSENQFMYNMTAAMKAHLILMFFMGLGGHNLFRYNWFIISAIIVLLLKREISGYGERLPEPENIASSPEVKLIPVDIPRE